MNHHVGGVAAARAAEGSFGFITAASQEPR
jgi:hypothetical protein